MCLSSRACAHLPLDHQSMRSSPRKIRSPTAGPSDCQTSFASKQPGVHGMHAPRPTRIDAQRVTIDHGVSPGSQVEVGASPPDGACCVRNETEPAAIKSQTADARARRFANSGTSAALRAASADGPHFQLWRIPEPRAAEPGKERDRGREQHESVELSRASGAGRHRAERAIADPEGGAKDCRRSVFPGSAVATGRARR